MTPDEKEQRVRAFDVVWAAVAKHNAGQKPGERCVFCEQPLVVEGLPPGGPFTQWLVHCPCGKSDATFKGL